MVIGWDEGALIEDNVLKVTKRQHFTTDNNVLAIAIPL